MLKLAHRHGEPESRFGTSRNLVLHERSRLLTIASLAVFFFAPTQVRAAAYTCSATFYELNNGNQVSIVNRNTDPYTLTNTLTTVATGINGLGYFNPTTAPSLGQNFLYGIDGTGSLVRIGTTGQEAISPLPIVGIANASPTAGGFDDKGNYFIVPGATGQGSLQKITGMGTLNAPAATSLTTTADPAPPTEYASSASWISGDFAFDPSDSESSLTKSVFYGLREPQAGVVYVYRFEISNPSAANPTVLVSRRATTLPAVVIGSVFIDSSGRLYGYNNGANANEGYFWIDHKGGSGAAIARNVSGSTPVSSSDGTNCVSAPAAIPSQLTLFKQTQGADGSTVFGGPFGFTLTNTGQGSGSATTVTPSNSIQVDGDSTNAGTQTFLISAFTLPVTINESSLPSGWSLNSASCVNGTGATVGSLSGTTYTIPGAQTTSGSTFTCTFLNRRPLRADLQITKTNTPANGPYDQASDTVSSGASTTYQLVTTNLGPDTITGAIVTDTPGTGLNCPGGNPVTITGDGVPTGTFTVSQLLSPGIVLGALLNGQSTTITFTCTVEP